jgi:hypothetical protein
MPLNSGEDTYPIMLSSKFILGTFTALVFEFAWKVSDLKRLLLSTERFLKAIS